MRGRLPSDYRPPPPMDDVVAYYVKAFFQISRSRPILFDGTPGYLSLGSIADYVAVFGEPYDVEEFAHIIFDMDGVYVPIVSRKQKSRIKSGPSKGERIPMMPPAKGR